MKIFIFILLFVLNSQAQVGIGTTDLEPSVLLKLESKTQAFVTTRVSTAQMKALVKPLEGSFVFNITEQSPYVYINGAWVKFESNRTPSLLLRKDSGTFQTSLTSEFPFPLNASNVLENDTSVFKVDNAQGKVTVLKDGIYVFAATLSTKNLNPGNRKFSLKLYKNDVAVGNLSAISFSMPKNDFWGGNGVIMINANANDVFDLRYFLNENTAKNIAILTYNITKLR
ncbi:hypothetical protein ACFSX9_03035 [Flavobacterium ardleyense]|uniref:C1q domain-containing protein n=1 Tax=Flavobacterium ardleyense TaxID=2038737 RepID=A0ABW5Z4M6_9FLAO